MAEMTRRSIASVIQNDHLYMRQRSERETQLLEESRWMSYGRDSRGAYSPCSDWLCRRQGCLGPLSTFTKPTPCVLWERIPIPAAAQEMPTRDASLDQ